MPQVSVMVSFEADTQADADAKVAAWTLHEGCAVNGAMMVSMPPLITDEGGNVVPAPPPEPPPEPPPVEPEPQPEVTP